MRNEFVIAFASMVSMGAVISTQAGEKVLRADHIEVNNNGAFVVRDFQDSSGKALGSIGEADGFVNPQLVTSPRWDEADGGLAWICESVSLGDNGASVMAGKGLNNESVSLYPTGDVQSIFNYDTLGSEYPQVDVADRAPVSAAYIVFDKDPGGDFDFEGSIHVFSNTGNGTPAWSYTFPRTLNYFGGGVALSDNGNVVLAWKADPNIGQLRIEAFKGDGTPISSGLLDSNGSFNSRQTRLSDDGSRAYFNIGTAVIIYNVATGTEEFRTDAGASFDSHALSGDGKRFAYGGFGLFRVFEETSPGNWTQVASDSFPGGTYVARVDLNRDGSKLAYEVQRYSPAYDHIEVGLHDVDSNTRIFNTSYDAPGTTAQLAAAGIKIDDLGEYIAGTSWGDSFNLTPETFVFDSSGNATAEIDARGSGFDVDIDADGDVAASGHKAVHANEFGSGGDVIVLDSFDQGLHVLGYPQAGSSVNLQLDQPGNNIFVAVTLALNPLGNPVEVDLTTKVAVLGPFNVPNSGMTVPINIPNIPFVKGNQFHFQAGHKNGSALTNKVSIRVQP